MQGFLFNSTQSTKEGNEMKNQNTYTKRDRYNSLGNSYLFFSAQNERFFKHTFGFNFLIF
jgi:hypothetical protein